MKQLAIFSGVLLVGAAHCAPQLKLTPLVTTSGIGSAVQVVQDPVRSNVQYVVRRMGIINVIKDGELQPGSFLYMPEKVFATGGDSGLLGMAFVPGTNGNEFVIKYSSRTESGGVGDTKISKFSRSLTNELRADHTENSVMRIGVDGSTYHKGGGLTFGSDGHMYVSLGDADPVANYDSRNNAQDPNSLHGKVLRVDITGDDFGSDPDNNYRIPVDNPFYGADSRGIRDEVYAMGLRNPYRMAFDDFGPNATGALLLGDVGQITREEINAIYAGKNYGWREYEGTWATGRSGHGFSEFEGPLHEYTRGAVPGSVIGGRVYRGESLGSFYKGRYFFGDFRRSEIWSFKLDYTGGVASMSDLLLHGELDPTELGFMTSIDFDANGDLLVTTLFGKVNRIELVNPVPEPGTIAALGLGLGWLSRKRRAKASS